MKAKSILVAHFNKKSRIKICKLLSNKGYITYQSTNSSNTLRLVRSFLPDLVLIDTKLPGMHSYKVGKIIEKDKLSNVIFIIDRIDSTFEKNIENMKIYAYILKPIRSSQLYQTVNFALENMKRIGNLESKILDLENEIETKKIINKAKLKLMKDLDMKEDEAYKKLRNKSMNQSKKMIDVANEILKN